MASSSSSPHPSMKPLDLEITIVSAKHLKNVNWQNGDLKPYAVFWLEPDRRLATKADHSGSTRPVWNERFTLPINLPLEESRLTLEIFHSKPSETSTPLVGTLRFALKDLVDSNDPNRIRKFDLRRPSGRPQGKICVKLGIRERPVADYHINPPSSYYYSSAAPHFPPPPGRDYRGYSSSPYTSIPPPPVSTPSPPPPPPPPPAPSSSLPPYPYGTYSDMYSYYPAYYSQPPLPPPPRPFFDRQSSYGGPSAPVDYTPYDQKPKGNKMGLGTGLAVGAVAGALGGLALEEGLKYEEDKIAERVENNMAARDDYSDYRGDY